MEVAITELRTHLSSWLARVRDGEEVIVTERSIPIARLTAIASSDTLTRLTDEGLISPPRNPRRPQAVGRVRPRSRRPLADIVSEQRG